MAKQKELLIKSNFAKNSVSNDKKYIFMGHQFNSWVKHDLVRYQQLIDGWQFVSKGGFIQKRSKNVYRAARPIEYTNILNCITLEKIVLHSTSGKLLRSPSDCAVLDLAFSTISSQSPRAVYSRKSIAGFKLAKGALLGMKATLNHIAKDELYYKWYFLDSF